MVIDDFLRKHYCNIYLNYNTLSVDKKYLPKAREQAKFSKEHFNIELMNTKLQEIFNKHVPKPTQHMSLKLPKLNMAPKSAPAIKLPKLKKVE